ncbi:hypothetical protein [Rothia nasimurium]|uniref:hypothetical protein n=1 Tax=Rothia nasimurium TaxID=85336 RepID=UPI00117AD9DF|nr:hypothetical protein [Rothia nasimurium]
MSLVVEAVLKVALKEAFKSIIPYVIDPQKIDFLRFAGIAVCPNIDAHSEVNTHCLKPLEKKWATEALKQWVDEKFPTDTEILNRAKPRPKSP